MYRVMQSAGNEFQRSSLEALEARFASLYADHGPDVLAYALRRVERPDDAADVLAETFLVAWRRLEEVPTGTEARLWLYGVARRTLANQRRGDLRRARLAERLHSEFDADSTLAEPDAEMGETFDALKRLDRSDQEVLLLAGWEELAPTEIAEVLQISKGTARGRLHRARRRFRKQLAAGRAAPGAQISKLPMGEAR